MDWETGRAEPTSVPIPPSFASTTPTVVEPSEVDEPRRNLAEPRPNLIVLGQVWPSRTKFGGLLPKFGRAEPRLGRTESVYQTLKTNIGRVRAHLGTI